MIRTGSYYAYNADDGSFLACGSSNKMKKFFGISNDTLRIHSKNGKIYNSNKYDLHLKIKWFDGVIKDIEPTIKLKPRPKPQIERKPNKLKCNFVEVFKVFKHQEAEEEKEHMRNNFSVINLERVRFELKKHAKESYPYRIAFYTKKSPTTLVFDEYFLSLELAEQRMEYLKNFKGKKDNGDFWYDEYLELARFIQSEFIR